MISFPRLSWSLDETRSLILKAHGRDQLEKVAPSINSTVERQKYASFHYHEASRLVEKFTAQHLQHQSLLEVAFLDLDEGGAADEFQQLIIQAGAHLTACAQSLHTIGDILAHVIYYGLGFNKHPNALRARRISAASVLHKLNELQYAPAIGQWLSQSLADCELQHLHALVNHSKHRSIVKTALSEDQTGRCIKRHALKVQSFVYEDKYYPEIEATDFFRTVYERYSRLVVRTGNELNDFLSNEIKSQPPGRLMV